MKLNQKSMLALLLAFCLVLTAIPAFAANLVFEKEGVNIPEEGLALTVSAAGGANGNARFVFNNLNQEQIAALGLTAATPNDFYKGFTLTCTFTYINAPTDGRPAEFTVEDVPVVISETRGSTGVLLGANIGYLIDYSAELSAYKAEHPDYTYEQILSTSFQTAYTYSNCSVKRGTWGVETYDTGLFPEGTIFLSALNFQSHPSIWGGSTYGSAPYNYYAAYKDIYATDGPVQFFNAKESGTYHIWVTEFAYPSNLDRNPIVNFNGESYDFTAEAISGVGSGTWMWAPEKNEKTLTLTAGENVAVQLSAKSGGYARLGTIALVPEEASAAFKAAMTDEQRLSNMNTQAEYSSLQSNTTNAYVESANQSVKVTVNEKACVAETGRARNRYYPTYVNAAGRSVYAFAARLTGANEYPTYPTVLDAVADYLIKEADGARVSSEIPFLFANGEISGYTVKLNGTAVTNLDLLPVKEGDVISLEENTGDEFAPINLGNVITNSGGKDPNDGLYQDELKDKYNYKFVTGNNAATNPNYKWPFDITKLNAFEGCYINGYVTYKMDISETSGDEREMTVFIQDLPVTCSAIQSSTNRLELGTNWSNPNNVEVDGLVYSPENYILPGKISPGYYDIYHLYLTNAKSAGEAKVTAIATGDGAYLISANKSMPIVLMRVTKDETGNIISTSTENHVLDFTGSGINVKIQDNETVYVWRGNFLGKGAGTMKPLCEPLTK